MFIKYLRNTSFCVGVSLSLSLLVACKSDKMEMNFQLIKLTLLFGSFVSTQLLFSIFDFRPNCCSLLSPASFFLISLTNDDISLRQCDIAKKSRRKSCFGRVDGLTSLYFLFTGNWDNCDKIATHIFSPCTMFASDSRFLRLTTLRSELILVQHRRRFISFRCFNDFSLLTLSLRSLVRSPLIIIMLCHP